MIQEILETDSDGNPTLTRTRIIITDSLIGDPTVLRYVGQEAWVYNNGAFIWIKTDDDRHLILLPYMSDQKPGEYKIIE